MLAQLKGTSWVGIMIVLSSPEKLGKEGENGLVFKT